MSLALSACSAQESEYTRDYGEIEVPVSRLSSDDARERGRELFADKCALCHGKRADGNGVRSKGLSRRPTAFTNPEWRASTSPMAVFKVLSEGKRGTSMPAWPTLSDDQKWDVVAYVLSVAEDS
jgi:high-affinity iron transporter